MIRNVNTYITLRALLWHPSPSPAENTEVGRRQASPGSAPHTYSYSIRPLTSLLVLAHVLAVARAQPNVSACAAIPTLLTYSRTSLQPSPSLPPTPPSVSLSLQSPLRCLVCQTLPPGTLSETSPSRETPPLSAGRICDLIPAIRL